MTQKAKQWRIFTNFYGQKIIRTELKVSRTVLKFCDKNQNKISMMKPFGAGPKRRRSGAGLPPGPRAVSVLARRSPAKRSPFKRKPLNSGLGASALPLMSAMDMGSSAAGDQPCNIKVAVRVRPENEREMAGASR